MLNVGTGRTERIGRILMMHANDREEVDEVYAGDIAAAVGIKQVITGDTLAAPDAPIHLENIVFPEPVIKVAVEPKTKVDQEKMSIGARPPGRGGPDLPGAHQRGDRPDRDLRHGRAAPRGDRRPHEARVRRRGQRRPPAGLLPRDRARHRREDRRQVRPPDRRLGPVRRRLHQPRAGARRGLRVRQQDQGRRDPLGIHPGRQEGHRGGARERRQGRATRWSTCKVTLTDGKYHDVDSSEIAFKVAGSIAFKEAAKRAKPVLLEPIFAVEVVTPEDFLGDVIGDLSRRRGRVEGQERRGNALAVTAQGAPQRDVRLRDRPALEHAGAGQLHDAVRELRRGPAEHRREDRRSSAPASRCRPNSLGHAPGLARPSQQQSRNHAVR